MTRHLPADLAELLAIGLLVERAPGVFCKPSLEYPVRMPAREHLQPQPPPLTEHDPTGDR